MDSEIITCWRDGFHIGPSYNVTRKVWNCKDHFLNCDCPSIEADPDIAGIGVVAAFLTSASLTLFATILCLVLSRNNTLPTYNPIDEFFRHYMCEPVQNLIGHHNSQVWGRVLYDMVVGLSDQQLVTGIALLVTAIIKLYNGSITVYHLNIVTDLVWFSSNTHLLSLLVVRSFEQSVKPNQRQPANNARRPRQFKAKLPSLIRALLMCILAGMLLYLTWVSACSEWYGVLDCPAQCTLPYGKGGSPLQWAIVNFVLVLYTYPLALFMLSRGSRIFWVDKCRPTLIDDKSLVAAGQKVNWGQHGSLPGKGLKAFFLSVWFFLSSDMEAILEQIAWHVLGYYWLFSDRDNGHIIMDESEKEKENGLGFGQLVPLFLLMLPVVQFFESWAGKLFPHAPNVFLKADHGKLALDQISA
ncbi:hypothetical protein JX266_010866 [Neoarthrinium moseri]|nr:hypothetical protein JX266_010866 [Neoarthrinium moseri]